MAEPIKISGLNEFRANLKAMDAALPKALRVAFNAAAEIVLADARPRVPSRSGRARASMKVKSTQAYSRVAGGGTKAPYYPWLDFGGKVGRNRSVSRPFLKDGRYIYDAYYRNTDRYVEALQAALIDVAKAAGIEVE